MRLFLLPISTRRTLIYCQRRNIITAEQNGWLDQKSKKAADMWAGWEKKESGWQRKVVDYGNQALKRIPFEEWGLKSVPPLSARRKKDEIAGKEIVDVSFPPSFIPGGKVLEVLKSLSTEREGLHKKRMVWSIVGMPIVAPFALVPVIPNLPFFYLVFRAWSHWKALLGSKHIQFLLDKDLVKVQASPILDELYSGGQKPFEATAKPNEPAAEPIASTEETMLLTAAQGKEIATALEIPELYMELKRAVWQVEKALETQKEIDRKQTEENSSNTKPKKDN